MALDLQQRTAEHGNRWNHAKTETGNSRISLLLATAKSGMITVLLKLK
jgi:hypothetical protein